MSSKTFVLIGVTLMIATLGVSLAPVASASPECDHVDDHGVVPCALWTAECLKDHYKTPAWCYP